ncbi:MAG: methyltransferase domain-containing protein [Gammaproteobacteria bacterium]|nr:methyltransferase domain-containing protein [Gammaproteobacteria bacterium]
MLDTNHWSAESYSHANQIQRSHARKLLEDYAFQTHADILDVGCGDGEISKWLAQRAPEGHTIGIDRSADMIQHATQQHKSIANLSFKKLDAIDIDYDNKFDLITSFSCIHWIEKKAQLLKKMSRALKPHGAILLTFPVGDGDEVIEHVPRILNQDKWQQHYGEYTLPVHWVTMHELKQWLQDTAFTVDSLVATNDYFELANLEVYRQFISALPLFTHINDPDHIKTIIDEVVARFGTYCQKYHNGKVVFPIKNYIIKAHV